MKQILILLLFSGYTVSLDTQTQNQDINEEEILTVITVYYKDFSDRNWEKFSKHFWDRATLTTVWQPSDEDSPRVISVTVPEFVEQAHLGPDSKPIFEEKMTNAEVRVYKILAHVWAHYDARFGDPGNITEWKGIDAFTLIKHEGKWKITSLAYTDL